MVGGWEGVGIKISWLEKNRKINNRGGGGGNYSALESNIILSLNLSNNQSFTIFHAVSNFVLTLSVLLIFSVDLIF